MTKKEMITKISDNYFNAVCKKAIEGGRDEVHAQKKNWYALTRKVCRKLFNEIGNDEAGFYYQDIIVKAQHIAWDKALKEVGVDTAITIWTMN